MNKTYQELCDELLTLREQQEVLEQHNAELTQRLERYEQHGAQVSDSCPCGEQDAAQRITQRYQHWHGRALL